MSVARSTLAAAFACTASGQIVVAAEEQAALSEYCPAAKDLGFDYTSNPSVQTIHDQGWDITGGARVHSTAAFNLLGGSVEFDYDATGGHEGVNNNFYTISPDLKGGAYTEMGQYCDAQKEGAEWCMELDIIEANGNCGGATTLHTYSGSGWPKCDNGGCQALYNFHGKTKMHIKTEYDTSGVMTVYIDGKAIGYDQMSPKPDGSANSVIAETMKRVGVVFQSSQWGGWVPEVRCGGGGDEASAHFSLSNLRIKGSVVSGPEPQKCSGPSPSPTPAPTPAPTPGPTPPAPTQGTCHWQSCSNNEMGDWCGQSKTQCEACGGGTWCAGLSMSSSEIVVAI